MTTLIGITKQEIKNGDQQLMNNDAQCEALEKEI